MNGEEWDAWVRVRTFKAHRLRPVDPPMPSDSGISAIVEDPNQVASPLMLCAQWWSQASEFGPGDWLWPSPQPHGRVFRPLSYT